MLPIRVNLLSPEKKKYLLQMISYQFIKSLCELVLIVVILISIAIIGSEVVLQKYFVDLSQNTNIIDSQQSDISKKIKKINNAMVAAEQVQGEYVLWSSILTDVFSSVPDGVVISSIVLDENEGVYTFSGSAGGRQDLLSFQENLEKLEKIENIEIPLSQLTEKENFTFSFSAQIK